jgi:GMP synthase (glutamine-hydrolysing)
LQSWDRRSLAFKLQGAGACWGRRPKNEGEYLGLRKIMIFQHVGHEPLGTLNPMLKAAGFRIRYVNFGRTPDFEPELEGYKGLVVLGGPMGVYEVAKHPHLKAEMKCIAQALKMDIPILGICLGAQLLAEVLGGKVFKAKRWEFGWHELQCTPEGHKHTMFECFKRGDRVYQMHQDTFTLPKSAVHLARTEICENQAFAYGDKVVGMQFHLEADRAMIERWLKRHENREIVEAHPKEFTQEGILADTARFSPRASELSDLSFGKFIEIFQLPERQILLGSTR